MKPIIRLDDTQRKALQKQLRDPNGPKVLHAVLVLLLSVLSPKQVVEMLGLGLSTLYDRATRWACDGVASLGHRPRSGRPREMEARQDAHVESYLGHSPRKYGHCTNVWTCRLLSKTLRFRTGQLCSDETVRRHLHELKWRWNRPRHGPARERDPEAAQKRARLEHIKAHLEPNAHLLYVDEADFNLLSQIRSMWSKQGEQPVFTTPGNNKKVYAFGAYDPAGKRFIYRVQLRKRSREFIEFLRQILQRFSGKVYVVLDNVKTHKAACVQAFVEAHKDRLELVFIPSYSPQDNEEIERVWGTTKTWVNGNDCCRDVSELKRKTHSGLASFQQWVRLNDVA